MAREGTAPAARILVVDDEPTSRSYAREVLELAGYGVCEAENGKEAIRSVSAAAPDAVVCDLFMPELDGRGFLAWVRQHAPELDVVIVTAHADLETAVEAMHLGACDYIAKPFRKEQLLLRVERALERRALLRRTAALQQELEARETTAVLVGEDATIQNLRRRIQLVAATDVHVLVSGETGTGKELVARALHRGSSRRDGPFVAVNCAALPEALIASELFGHERGAFTTAVQARAGRFETAEGGTLLLDEVGDLPLPTQGTLLRVLQERCFERVGSSRTVATDVRVVAATKQNLRRTVDQGRFREDLYFRLNVVELACPPLRERRNDIPLLVEHFLQRARVQGSFSPGVAPEALRALLGHEWPGNVRELENVVSRAAILASGRPIQVEHLELGPCVDGKDGPLSLVAAEKTHLQRVLGICGWNRTEAARILGIDRSTLQRTTPPHQRPPETDRAG